MGLRSVDLGGFSRLYGSSKAPECRVSLFVVSAFLNFTQHTSLLMAFYIGHGSEYQSESDASSDFADPDLDDDSEWDDPAGAFTRDTRKPVPPTTSSMKQEAPEQVPVPPAERSSYVPQPPSEPVKQRAVSTAPKPAHIKLRQVAPKSSSSPTKGKKTALYLTKHC